MNNAKQSLQVCLLLKNVSTNRNLTTCKRPLSKCANICSKDFKLSKLNVKLSVKQKSSVVLIKNSKWRTMLSEKRTLSSTFLELRLNVKSSLSINAVISNNRCSKSKFTLNFTSWTHKKSWSAKFRRLKKRKS